MAEAGIDITLITSGTTQPDGTRQHVLAYTTLRGIVRNHFTLGNEAPQLAETQPWYGGYEEAETEGGALADMLRHNAEFVRQGQAISSLNISLE